MIELFVILFLISLNGLFAMSEMAVVSSRKARLKKLVLEGHRGAVKALKLSEANHDFLASIQVGISLIGVLAGAFSGATLAEKLAATFATIPALADHADAYALGLVVIFVTYASLIFGELVPKRLALSNPELIASRVAGLMIFFGKALKPIVYILSVSTQFILKLAGVSHMNSNTVTEEEIKILIEEGAQSGVFDKIEETMMNRVLRLDDRRISELMTPRTQVIGLDSADSVEEILSQITEHSHSYYPVFEKSTDTPNGVLSSKTILAKLVRKEPIVIRDCLTTPLFLPETLTADTALEQFREHSKHIAFVVDEYGGFSGIITVYDIAESILGDMPNNNQAAEKKIVKRTDGSLLVEGHMPFHELAHYLDLSPVEGGSDFQTAGGFMMEQLGKIPKEGEFIKIDHYKFEVVDMDRHRVDKILVKKLKLKSGHPK